MVFNGGMNQQAIQLIDAHGGDTALAKKLGFQTPSGSRRVHNWRDRGIPPRIQLDHPELFRPIPSSSADPASTQPAPVAQTAQKEAA